MSLGYQEGSVEFPYCKKDVYNAIITAIEKIDGIRIESADYLSGHLQINAGVSLFSWGEIIPIYLSEISPEKTRMTVMSNPKIGMAGNFWDMGKNRKNIASIINTTSKMLKDNYKEIKDYENSQIEKSKEINFNPILESENELKPNMIADSWIKKGNKLLHEQQFEESINCYDKALAIIHDNYDAINNKGLALLKLGRIEDAEECLTKLNNIKKSLK